MEIQNIIMTAADHAQLDRVIALAGDVLHRADGELKARQSELERAQFVAAEEIPADRIT